MTITATIRGWANKRRKPIHIAEQGQPLTLDGQELVIHDNRLLLDGKHIFTIVEYGSVFMRSDDGKRYDTLTIK